MSERLVRTTSGWKKKEGSTVVRLAPLLGFLALDEVLPPVKASRVPRVKLDRLHCTLS